MQIEAQVTYFTTFISSKLKEGYRLDTDIEH